MKLSKRVKLFLCYNMMYVTNHILGIDKKKFFISGMVGKYNDNAKAFSRKLHDLHPEIKQYWVLSNEGKNDKHLPDYVIPVQGLFNIYFHMSMSACWVTCGIIDEPIYKNKKQLYVNLWHGDRGFKKILYDKYNEPKTEKSFHSKNCDLMISGSDFFDKVIQSAFDYHGEVLKVGSPRNDMLLKNNRELWLSIRKELGIDENVKVLLYAPTFRDNSMRSQTENLDIERTISALESTSNDHWICLGRFHPMLRGRGVFNSDSIIDVTSYYDMANLLLISDALITDYSSSPGDFVLMNKPVYIFQPDRDEYIKNARDFYFDLDKSPYWIAKDQQELEALISATNDQTVKENCRAILDFYGTKETGNASGSIVNYVAKKSIIKCEFSL